MSAGLKIETEIENAELTTLEGLRVNFIIANRSEREVTIAGPEALSVEVYCESESPIRRMDGASQSEMLGTCADKALQGALPAGEECEWTIDFTNYHYPLSVGRYEVVGVLELPNGGGQVRGAAVGIQVVPAKITGIKSLRDNPVLDSLTHLIETAGPNGKEHYLRLQSHDRPLASWYSQRIITRKNAEDMICAQASQFQTDNFDPFFRRWVVWREGETLLAHAFVEGQPEHGSSRRASLPPRHRPIAAYYDASDRLFVILLDKRNRLRCYQLRSRTMTVLFSKELPLGLDSPPIVAADEDGIHLLLAKGGLSYYLLDHKGESIHQHRLFRSRLNFHSARFDLEARTIQSIYRDGRHGKSLELFHYDLQRRNLKRHQTGALRLRGELAECAFDRGLDGKFHLLVRSNRDKLYYYRNHSGPWRVGQRVGTCFPRVIAGDRTFLGSYTTEHGYRFLQFQPAEDLPRVDDFSR